MAYVLLLCNLQVYGTVSSMTQFQFIVFFIFLTAQIFPNILFYTKLVFSFLRQTLAWIYDYLIHGALFNHILSNNLNIFQINYGKYFVTKSNCILMKSFRLLIRRHSKVIKDIKMFISIMKFCLISRQKINIQTFPCSLGYIIQEKDWGKRLRHKIDLFFYIIP